MFFRSVPNVLAVLVCAITLLSAASLEAKGNPPKNISVQEAADLLKQDKVLILDVRSGEEFAVGHLPHAENMNFFGGRFENDLAELPRDAEILIYCRSGTRSAAAAAMMEEQGFSHVFHMNQGFDAWKKAGLPVEMGSACRLERK